MSSEYKRYSGYQGYSNKVRKNNLQNSQKVFSSEVVAEEMSNTLPEPVMNVDSLFKLADFLNASKADISFPEVTVMPDVLKSVGKFVNERRKMKYAHKEFEGKLTLLADGLDKQYHVEMQKIQNETEIQLAQINGDVQQGITDINRYYDLEMQKIMVKYNLKNGEMKLHYQDLEKQRRAQERIFNKMIEISKIERKKANKALQEAEQMCDFYSKKMRNNTATDEERKLYMELLKIRIGGVDSIVDIVPKLAAMIK